MLKAGIFNFRLYGLCFMYNTMICQILILQWVYMETKAFKVKQKWLHKNTAMLKQGYEWYLGIIEGHCLVPCSFGTVAIRVYVHTCGSGCIKKQSLNEGRTASLLV